MKTIIKADIIDNNGNVVISLPEYVGVKTDNIDALRKEVGKKYNKHTDRIIFTYQPFRIIPKYCFSCGKKLIEQNLGFLSCEDDQCGEIYLPYIDDDGNQCVMNVKHDTFTE